MSAALVMVCMIHTRVGASRRASAQLVGHADQQRVNRRTLGTKGAVATLRSATRSATILAMTIHTKTNITLPADEHAAIVRLKQELGLPTNVEVVRQALALLAAEAERQRLARAYASASRAVRLTCRSEMLELDAMVEAPE